MGLTDKKLLESAARAAGIEGRYQGWCATVGGPAIELGDCLKNRAYWNPLVDDADAFRLAVNLNISINLFIEGRTLAFNRDRPFSKQEQAVEIHLLDPYAATRRAIVRAATCINAAPIKESQ